MLDNRRFYPSVQEAFEHWKNRIVGLGFGYRLGLDLPGERRGYIPNSKVYDKAYKGRWNSSTIISISIGQGEILATPLQIANLGVIIANRGRYRRPHVVKAIQGIPLDTAYTNWQNSGISPANMEYIVEGMARAVTGGTCHAANFAPGEIEVCGKTGTAENPHGKDHSAFLGSSQQSEGGRIRLCGERRLRSRVRSPHRTSNDGVLSPRRQTVSGGRSRGHEDVQHCNSLQQCLLREIEAIIRDGSIGLPSFYICCSSWPVGLLSAAQVTTSTYPTFS